MSGFGVNDEPVRQILTALQSDRLFKAPPAQAPLNTWCLVGTSIEAERKSFEELYSGITAPGSPPEAEGEPGCTWIDVKAQQHAYVLGKLWDLPGGSELVDELHRAFGEAVREMESRLLVIVEEEWLVDEASADLRSCINARAAMGRGNAFFEGLWEAYEAGYFPVGWEGEYPDGSLCVYVPAFDSDAELS